jgi:hypothetical protein
MGIVIMLVIQTWIDQLFSSRSAPQQPEVRLQPACASPTAAHSGAIGAALLAAAAVPGCIAQEAVGET